MSKTRSNDMRLPLEDLPGFSRTEPQYFRDPMIDRLLDVILMMGGEMWSMRERQLVTEHLIEKNGKVSQMDIEMFKPDSEFRQQIDRRRKAFIRQVFSGLYSVDEQSKPLGDHFSWLTRDKA